MQWFLYLIGIIWVALGSSYILYTERCRTMVAGIMEKCHRFLLAFLPLLIGILLLASAQASSHMWFIVILGFLGIAKSVFIIVNPRGYCDAVSAWFLQQASDQTYRLIGIMMLILGTAIISWVV